MQLNPIHGYPITPSGRGLVLQRDCKIGWYDGSSEILLDPIRESGSTWRAVRNVCRSAIDSDSVRPRCETVDSYATSVIVCDYRHAKESTSNCCWIYRARQREMPGRGLPSVEDVRSPVNSSIICDPRQLFMQDDLRGQICLGRGRIREVRRSGRRWRITGG